ncbi:MAG TPA: universal stress protein [Vicinamibacteria bacterium]|nr:universal stress protein [Vicinamibacteria bacterium]
MMQLSRILVPTDFSDAAGRALEQALGLARSGDVEILLLHGLPPLIPMVSPMGGTGLVEMGRLLDDYTRHLREDASRKLEELKARVPKKVKVETALDENVEPHEAILRKARSWNADLIAMGTHGRGGLERLLMGSIASKVLHRSDRHLMLLRSDSILFASGKDPGSILVPVDFSDHSHRALALARYLSSRHGASVHLLHVVELLHTPLKPGGLSSQLEETPGLREKYLEALRDMLGETSGDVTVADGSPAGGILWWREKLGARLVVMGSRGLTGIERLLVGSAAETVARFCEVPVVVVK